MSLGKTRIVFVFFVAYGTKFTKHRLTESMTDSMNSDSGRPERLELLLLLLLLLLLWLPWTTVPRLRADEALPSGRHPWSRGGAGAAAWCGWEVTPSKLSVREPWFIQFRNDGII